MFRNYIKIAWRNIRKHKFYASINVLGLTVGMTCCFLIFMFVRFELSYDNFQKKGDQLYRVVTDLKTPTDLLEWSSTAAPVGPNLKAFFPEVLNTVRVSGLDLLVQKGDNKYQEKKVAMADSSFFRIFSFPLLKGNPDKALAAPYSVVLSEKAARKYFGQADPIGQSLFMEGKFTATVTGVMKDMPLNSHMNFDMLMSLSTLTKAWDPDRDKHWGNLSLNTYVVLPKGYDPMKLERKLPAFMKEHNTAMSESNMYIFHLERFKDIYLRSARGSFVSGSLSNIYIFSVIAIFILFIAIINFINLATAKATERAREVGVRKSIGAFTTQLTFQFLCETILLSLIAFIFSLTLCQLLLPAFNELVGKTIRTSVFEQPHDLLWFSGIALGVGLLAGVYPALVLSAYKPVAVLKGTFSSGNKGVFLRRGLVAFQFAVAIVLIAGVTIVYRQLSYMHRQELGFKKEQVLVLRFDRVDSLHVIWPVIKQQALQLPNVRGATFSSSVPGNGWYGAHSEVETRSGEMQATNLNMYSVDDDFIKQYGMKVIAGRAFSPAFPTDTIEAFMVNEATAASMGYANPADIVGKKFDQWGRKGKIIGVVQNFNYESLKQKIVPLSFRPDPALFSFLSLNISTNDIPQTIASLKQLFERVAPQRRFDYFFLDEVFNSQYQSDERFGRLTLLGSILAILLAALGLLGLISYAVTQRTKEIGIRKVLGASVGSLLFLLSKDFLKLVVIATCIAVPIAWFAMHRWLQDFAYRINIEWWIFALAGMIALAIAIVTVSVQSVKAALMNPVRSLRTE